MWLIDILQIHVSFWALTTNVSVSREPFSLLQHSALIWLYFSLWWSIANVWNPPCELSIFVLQQLENLRRRFGTIKMHLSPPVDLPAVRSKAVVLLLLIRCWLLLPLWNYVIVLWFVVRNFMSILVLQSFWWARENWMLCFVCLPGVSWLLCGSSSRCHGFVCSLGLWYFLIIFTYRRVAEFHIRLTFWEKLPHRHKRWNRSQIKTKCLSFNFDWVVHLKIGSIIS